MLKSHALTKRRLQINFERTHLTSQSCSTNFSESSAHLDLSCASTFQLAVLPVGCRAQHSMMSWFQRFLGLAWARPHARLEWRSGCHSIAMELHFCVCGLARLPAHFHCLFLHVASHSLWPAFLSCASVHLAVRRKKSGQGSKTSTSSSLLSASL